MNDIEVLERLLEEGFSAMCPLEAQAIENLLKERQSDKERIKDLEEINEAHKKENGELREELEKKNNMYLKEYNEHIEKKRQNGVLINNELILKRELENSIPKSLIKEKIEEYKKQYNKIVNEVNEQGIIGQLIDFKEISAKIQVLEELLKGE